MPVHVLLFFLLFFLLSINCQIKIPLKYYPIYKYDNSTPSSIIKGFLHTKLYTNIEIGTPKRLIQIPLEFYSNDFYISDNPKYQFSQEPEKFSDLKLYDKSSSTSSKTLEKNYLQGDNFYYADYDQDIFYIDNTTFEFEFYFPHILKEVESGGIGLQLMPYSNISTSTPNPQRTFLKKLKNKNIIKDYYWSIFYNNKENNKQDEGFILLGSLPHEYNNDLGYYPKNYFKENIQKNINADLNGDTVLNKIYVDEIYGFKGNDKNDKIDNLIFSNSSDLNIEIDYSNGGIKAPEKVKTYLENIYKDYISNQECFFDNFNITNMTQYSFFYCKKSENILSNIKKNFPGFNFRCNNFEYNFNIVFDDVFIEENNYIFCLLFFDSKSDNNWVMGKLFVKKYQFSFNPDKKSITFYSTNNNEIIDDNKKKENTNYLIYVVFGGIIFILLIIIVILIWKFYLKEKYLRKKRANELDDDYDYIQKKDNKKENNTNEKLTDEPYE